VYFILQVLDTKLQAMLLGQARKLLEIKEAHNT